MSERKSRTVKVANLPESKALCNITNKPIALIFFAWIVFVWMLYLVEVKILAIPFGIYCVIITVKEEKRFSRVTKIIWLFMMKEILKNVKYIIYPK